MTSTTVHIMEPTVTITAGDEPDHWRLTIDATDTRIVVTLADPEHPNDARLFADPIAIANQLLAAALALQAAFASTSEAVAS